MCGIAAIYAYHDAAPEADRLELRRIRDRMASRGPDGAGEWYSSSRRAALGHRRLAVIDLSERAAQPMIHTNGEFVISFNGEIYNHRELRAGLEKEGRVFKTQSDTEVLLHLYEAKGEAMLPELRGMFAFALWDGRKKRMLLARDPYGIKPLYYADDGGTVRIASQVKAILAGGKISRLPEPAGAAGFFLWGSVPEPFTLYREIRQIPAGSFVWVGGSGPSAPKKYFSIASVFTPHPSPLGRGMGEGVAQTNNEVREALLDSVRHHFVSDVPVGLFLSAGIDSGSLAGLAREAGFKNLRTLTLAFDEFEGTEQDEAPLAEEAARRYGTRHSTVRLTRDEFHRELPNVFEAMDQPSIDGINTYFVSRAARQLGWKAALSGLGGDELFGGYPSFHEIPRMVRMMAIPSKIPFSGDLFRHLFPLISRSFSPKFSGLLKYGGTYAGAYFLKRGLFMPWELESVLDCGIMHEGLKRLNLLQPLKDELKPDPGTPFTRVAALESSFYLRNQLLRDADWAGMAHSLEIRTPYADSFLLKKVAPMQGGRQGKSALINALKIPLPDKVTQRSKTGFSVPMEDWLEIKGNYRHTPWARGWAREVMNRMHPSNRAVVHSLDGQID